MTLDEVVRGMMRGIIAFVIGQIIKKEEERKMYREEVKRNEKIRRDVLSDLRRWRNRQYAKIIGPLILGGVGLITVAGVLDTAATDDKTAIAFLACFLAFFVVLVLANSQVNRVDEIVRNEVYKAIRKDEQEWT
jgi:hypothetical protein